jgi:hypothetical protein
VTRRGADKLQPLVAQIQAEAGPPYAFDSDACKEGMVAQVRCIEREIEPIEVAVLNIGANLRFSITETGARVYFEFWEMGALPAF